MSEAPSVQSSAPPWQTGEAPVHALPVERIAQVFGVDPASGLTRHQAAQRLAEFGPNSIVESARRSLWAILKDQFVSPVIWLLIAATIVSLVLGDWAEAIAIVIVILINTVIGFLSEWRATRSMEALRRLASETSMVLRDGQPVAVPAEEVVPGDIMLLEAGHVVTADARLLEVQGLTCDESTLTGESVPVIKGHEPVPADTMVAERTNMSYRGSSVARGSGRGIVVATGMATELGNIAELVAEAQASASPLEKKLDVLTRQLIWVTLILAAIIGLAGLLSGRDAWVMGETAIALAVAAIPEGLPVVATLALARGMLRLARHNVLVRRLSKVETLGSTTVIYADKTGTLTENRMRIARLVLPTGTYTAARGQTGRHWTTEAGAPANPVDDTDLADALVVAVLCNHAGEDDAQSSADPLEIALIDGADEVGFNWRELRHAHGLLREEPFDADVRMMATVHRMDGDCLVAVKGAPEAVLAISTHMGGADGDQPIGEVERTQWLARNSALAAEGLRVIAIARKWVGDPAAPAYQDLQFLGLIGLRDPPRSDAAAAVAACRRAGISVSMVTGDQVATARSIAQAVGIVDDGEARVVDGNQLGRAIEGAPDARAMVAEARVFARINPRQKLDLVAMGQQRGEIAAMTGDGVNDAPALRKADIGIALGKRGTQAAREAADMVIQDDALSSIVEAVRQGRIIFGNIRKFVIYLLSCNLSEILVIFTASVSTMPLPLLPLQILFLNLVTDVFPAIALGACRGTGAVMEQPPRDPRESILAGRHWRAIVAYGVLLTASVMAGFAVVLYGQQRPVEQAVTVAFLTMALGQLIHVFNMRHASDGIFANDVVRNPLVWAAVALCVGLVLAALYIPVLADILKLNPPDASQWVLIAGCSLLPLLVGQTVKVVTGRLRTSGRV